MVHLIFGDKELLVRKPYKQSLKGSPSDNRTPSTQVTTHHKIYHTELTLGFAF